jgi:hypothetical protein
LIKGGVNAWSLLMDWHFYDKTSLTTANTEEYASSVATSVVGQQRKSSVGLGMSALGGKAEVDFGQREVCL